MKNKSKDELIKLVNELEDKIGILENDVDYWTHEYNDVYKQLENERKKNNLECFNGISDINNFKFELLKSGLLNNEIEYFISNYLKYKNNQKVRIYKNEKTSY